MLEKQAQTQTPARYLVGVRILIGVTVCSAITLASMQPMAGPTSYLSSIAVIDEEIQPASAATPEATGVSVPGDVLRAAPVERWLSEHGDILWRFVLGRTRSREVAEEVVQETILAAMQGYANFAGGSAERTWLLGIAAHKIADHFRAVRRRAEGSGPGTTQPRDADKAEFHAMFTAQGMWARPSSKWGLDAGSTTENAEMLAALRRCIEVLPPSQAEAVWLRDLLNIPASEVCKAMGISQTNLWSRMHRARAALRACVEKSIGMSTEDSR
jgi:RNA polymerase sigma-70 factor, ECF subfamily